MLKQAVPELRFLRIDGLLVSLASSAKMYTPRGIQGTYDADNMPLSQSAAIRPVEMRNKPH